MTVRERLLEEENDSLKIRIQELEAELAQYRKPKVSQDGVTATLSPPPLLPAAIDKQLPPLQPEEYKRYGRQMILREIGLEGQTRLKASKVLVVGTGGLGCPAAAYLAGAGIGTLGLIDHDTVEISNLHRQILHGTSRVGLPKVHSALTALRDLNPHVNYVAHNEALTPGNALQILKNYDVVLDCTDHPSLRYLISDACVLLGKPIVSASALRTDGQLILLNSPPGRGPCYRCVWPRPPPAESVTSCGDGGVLGPVVGVMGVLQALETIKLISRAPAPPPPSPSASRGLAGEQEARMQFFSASAETPWRTLRMRGRRKTCVACGTAPTITRETMGAGGIDEYILFCSSVPGQLRLDEELRLDVMEVKRSVGEVLLVDVRDETQFGICSVARSINVPFERFQNVVGVDEEGRRVLPDEMKEVLKRVEGREEEVPMVIMCRLGNDSQVAARHVMESGAFKGMVFDVRGGLQEWAKVAPEDGVVEY